MGVVCVLNNYVDHLVFNIDDFFGLLSFQPFLDHWFLHDQLFTLVLGNF